MKHFKYPRKLHYYPFVISFVLLVFSCNRKRQLETSFYYWKTVYKHDSTESAYLTHFNTKNLYVRIMDVDFDEDNKTPIPISPIVFKDKLNGSLNIVPVVFIVNNVLKDISNEQLNILASHIVSFINAKVHQAGRQTWHELQIDCDWTSSTREKYFYLLKRLSYQIDKEQILSATLRLHQLKNQKTSGIPPVSKVMLMCYNMGNLRKYGSQNSILELNELKKFAGKNLKSYSLKMDIGLPLFSWAVAFRNRNYVGISRDITYDSLQNKQQFSHSDRLLYKALVDLPQYGLIKNDEIRWENSSPVDLSETSKFLSSNIDSDTLNIIYFHLDKNLLKSYQYARLEAINNIWR